VRIFLFAVFFFFTFISKSQKIEGVVLGDSKTIGNASVFLHEFSKVEITNQNGEFSFENIPNGTYHLHVNFLGYEPEVVLVQSPQKNPLTIKLHQSSIEIREIEIEESLLNSINDNRARNIEVLNQDQISNSTDIGLVEAMAKLPGVQMINIGNNAAKPIIRGLGFNRVLTNVNGIKQEGQQWGADHGLAIDEGNIESIEIVKGANSLIYGSDALGGVINMHQNSTLPDFGTSVNIGLKLNSVNMRYAPKASIGFRKGDFFTKISGSFAKAGDIGVPASSFNYNTFVYPIYNEQLKNSASHNYAGSISFGLIKKWGQVRLNHMVFDQKIGFFPGAHGRPNFNLLFDDSNRFDIDMPYQAINNSNTSIQTDFYLPNGWLELDVGFQQNTRQEFEIPHAHKLGPSPENNLALGLTLNTITANIRYHFAPAQGKSIVGVSGQHQQNNEEGFEYFLPSFNTSSTGIFWYREKPVTENVIVNYGARSDFLSQHIAQKNIPIYNQFNQEIGDTTLTQKRENSFQNITGAIGFVFKPNHTKVFKINLGSGFRFPTVPELSANGFHHGTFRFEVGNANLKPERTLSLDGSLNYHNKKFAIDVSPYVNYFLNYIFLEPTGKFASKANGGGQIHQYNQANSLHLGLEFFADWHIVEDLHAELKGDGVFGYNLNTNRNLPFMPPINLRLNLSYQITKPEAKNTAEVFAGSNYFASQNLVAINELKTPQSTIFNSGVSFRNKSKNPFQIKFEVQNLFNTAYLYHLSRFRLLNLPEAGRSLNMSINYKF
jgi:iron complex outermembrane recepter protein